MNGNDKLNMLSKTALALGMLYASVASAMPSYAPVGPQTNVDFNTVIAGGWTPCYAAAYGAIGTSVADAVSDCTGDLMMLAGGFSVPGDVPDVSPHDYLEGPGMGIEGRCDVRHGHQQRSTQCQRQRLVF